MASSNSSDVPNSESVSEILAPLAQPETSDSAMETSSDDATSVDSKEQKTDPSTDSPSQSKSISCPINEQISEESCLTAVTLGQDDTASECSGKDLVSDVGISSTKEVILATESGPSTSKDKPKSQDLVFSAGSGPSTARDISPPASSSKDLVSAAPSAISSAQRLSPSDSSCKELLSVGESDTPREEIDLIEQSSQPNSEVPSAESNIPCSLIIRDYIVSLFQKWQAYSIFLSDSIFLVPFLVIFILFSISAVVMGYVFVYKCPVAMEIPLIILFVGFLGCVANVFRILLLCHSYRSVTRPYVAGQRRIIVVTNCLFLILFSFELYTFFTITPNFQPGTEDYCNPIFHAYAYILNCVVAFLVVIMTIVHFPAFLFNSFQIGGPGLPDDDE